MTQWSRSLGRQVLVEWLLGCHSKVSSSSVPWSLVRNVRLHARPAPRLGTSGVGPAISVIGSPRAGPDAHWGLGRARRAGPLALLFTWETREIRVEMPEGRGSPSEEASQENGHGEGWGWGEVWWAARAGACPANLLWGFPGGKQFSGLGGLVLWEAGTWTEGRG